MMKNKKIALLASILVMTLAVGVYAGLQLSNKLEASWVVQEPGSNLELWWNAGTPSGDRYRGTSYYGEIGLKNNAQATYHVIVNFKISADVSLLADCIKITIFDEGSGTWIDLPMTLVTEGAKNVFTGVWGPAEGFDVGLGYYKVTPFYYTFEGNAPVGTWYHFEAWVEQK